jgi:hypothetical protein
VAAEEEVVDGRDGECVAHEDSAVTAEGEGHAAGDAVRGKLLDKKGRGTGRLLHFGVFLCVHYCCNWDTEVTGWSPEICRAMHELADLPSQF